ncbi:recombinase family protein [Alteromonas sp. C1M14]|nr:recombinase family protein [Alteromonas sp. C1M14]
MKQAEKELPVQSQIEKCRQHAESLNADIKKVFTDEGISGTSDNRPAFQQAITYCENFDVDYFVCWSTSRFARNALEAKLNKRRLANSNTKIAYVSQNIDDGDSGFIYEGILELFDEYYSRQVSQDTKRSMIANAQKGFFNGGYVTFGYQQESVPGQKKKTRLVPNPLETGTVNRIFELKLASYGGKQIAELLNAEGRLNRGKKWNKTTILELLRNERVVGKVAFGKKGRNGALPRSEWIIVDSHEPIVNIETFNAVQAMMDKQTNTAVREEGSAKSTRFFTGILKCGKCGQSMKIERAKGATKVYYYYNCGTKKAGLGCENRRINTAVFDPWMVDVICSEVFTERNLKYLMLQLNDLCGSWAQKKRDRCNDLIHQIREMERRNSRLYEMLEDATGVYNIQDLAPRLRSNNEAIRKLNTELAVAETEKPPTLDITEKDLTELSELLVDIIKTTNNPGKVREFFKTFLHSIMVQDDEIKVKYRPEALLSAHSGIVPSSENWLPAPSLLGTINVPFVLFSRKLPIKLRKAS